MLCYAMLCYVVNGTPGSLSPTVSDTAFTITLYPDSAMDRPRPMRDLAYVPTFSLSSHMSGSTVFCCPGFV